jgi:hypothetical protein
MCSNQQSDRPDPRASLTNLRRPMPLRQKLRLIARNNWIKIRTRSDCCGNHGEPGC